MVVMCTLIMVWSGKLSTESMSPDSKVCLTQDVKDCKPRLLHTILLIERNYTNDVCE